MLMSEPLQIKQIRKIVKKVNCIKNCNKDSMILDIGTTNLGKYTLPNKPAFATKILEVANKHDEK